MICLNSYLNKPKAPSDSAGCDGSSLVKIGRLGKNCLPSLILTTGKPGNCSPKNTVDLRDWIILV